MFTALRGAGGESRGARSGDFWKNAHYNMKKKMGKKYFTF